MANTKYYIYENFEIDFLGGTYAPEAPRRVIGLVELSGRAKMILAAPIALSAVAIGYARFVKGMVYLEEGMLALIGCFAFYLMLGLRVQSVRLFRWAAVLPGVVALLCFALLVLTSFFGIATQGMALRCLKDSGAKVDTIQDLGWFQQLLGEERGRYFSLGRGAHVTLRSHSLPERAVQELTEYDVFWELMDGVDPKIQSLLVLNMKQFSIASPGQGNVQVEWLNQLSDSDVVSLERNPGLACITIRLRSGVTESQARYLGAAAWVGGLQCDRLTPADFAMLKRVFDANKNGQVSMGFHLYQPEVDADSIAFLKKYANYIIIDDRPYKREETGMPKLPAITKETWKHLLNLQMPIRQVRVQHLDSVLCEMLMSLSVGELITETIEPDGIRYLTQCGFTFLRVDCLDQELIDSMLEHGLNCSVFASSTTASHESLNRFMDSLPLGARLRVQHQGTLPAELKIRMNQ